MRKGACTRIRLYGDIEADQRYLSGPKAFKQEQRTDPCNTPNASVGGLLHRKKRINSGFEKHILP